MRSEEEVHERGNGEGVREVAWRSGAEGIQVLGLRMVARNDAEGEGMSDKVVRFPKIGVDAILPEDVLDEALDMDLTEVVVIGWNKDGDLYFNASKNDAAEVSFLMDLVKHKLMSEVLK